MTRIFMSDAPGRLGIVCLRAMFLAVLGSLLFAGLHAKYILRSIFSSEPWQPSCVDGAGRSGYSPARFLRSAGCCVNHALADAAAGACRMTRKSLILAIGIVLFLLGSAGAALYLLARYEPAFYVRGNIEPGDQRKVLSGECIAEFFKVLNGIARGNGPWEGRLKEEQVNSYFAEDFITNHSVEYPLPEGFSEPRVALEADLIRLGFRYGSGWKSTVISIDMRVWLIAREPNAVALK